MLARYGARWGRPRADAAGTEAERPERGEARQAVLRGAQDGALVRACLGGEEVAWHTLVERHGALVYSVAVRVHALPAETADEVFQTVFKRLWHTLAELKDEQDLSLWLLRTADQACRDLPPPGEEPA